MLHMTVHASQYIGCTGVTCSIWEEQDDGRRVLIAQAVQQFYDPLQDADDLSVVIDAVARWCRRSEMRHARDPRLAGH